MANFPTSIKTFRTVEDLPGTVYAPSNKTTVYAKDTRDAYEEIVAIETTLGATPQSTFATVGGRLDAIDGTAVGTLRTKLADVADVTVPALLERIEELETYVQNAQYFSLDDMYSQISNLESGLADLQSYVENIDSRLQDVESQL